MQQMNDPDWKPPPTPLVTLTADNFTKFVKNENVALVLFYAPWHKECKAILPGKLASFQYKQLIVMHFGLFDNL